jgi:hypothetical protein
VNSPDRKGAAGRRTAPRPRLRYFAWSAAIVLVAAQAVLLEYSSVRWRPAVAFVLTVSALMLIVALAVRLAHRKASDALATAPPMAYAAPSRKVQDPDAPSERIGLAYELARRKVPANWIAARCGLPYAFVELIIAEVADSPGAPRRRD